MDLRLWSLAAAGCIPRWDVPELVLVRPADSPELRLVHVLSVSTDEATQLTVELSGADTVRRIAFPDFATTHEVPLLGLVEGEDYTATAILSDAAGHTITGGPVTFNAGVAAGPGPQREIHVNDTSRMEPGYTLYPAKCLECPINVVEAVDDEGRLVWQFDAPPPEVPTGFAAVTALQFAPSDGTLSGLVNNRAIRRFDLAHMNEEAWAIAEEASGVELKVPLPERFHAEAAFVEDGSFWALTHQTMRVDDFPVDASDLSVREQAEVRTDVVVHVHKDGQVLAKWDLWNDLEQDPPRIGFEEEDASQDTFGWSGANAVVPLGDDEFLVSLASQSAVIKFSGSDVVWILGNDSGWLSPWSELLLHPVVGAEGPPWKWFSQQHAPAFDESGRLWLFDNGNYDRGTPYEPAEDEPDYSRVVAYDIDETLGTVSEAFSFVEKGPPMLFSKARGNADPLPVTGNVLATYGAVQEEVVARAEDPEAGKTSMRILEIDQSGTVVFDLALTGDDVDSPLGWQGDRAIRVSSLYPSDVIVTVLE